MLNKLFVICSFFSIEIEIRKLLRQTSSLQQQLPSPNRQGQTSIIATREHQSIIQIPKDISLSLLEPSRRANTLLKPPNPNLFHLIPHLKPLNRLQHNNKRHNLGEGGNFTR
jgi:hypothetical protein